jgi:hypothetical protein
MNLSEIVLNVNAELHPSTNIDSIIKRWANRGQKRFVSSIPHQFSWMKINGLTLTTTSGVSEYALSPLVNTAKDIIIRDQANQWKIKVVTREQFQAAYPDASDASGSPEIAYLSGFSPVSNQPSSASLLSFVSSAADTAVVKIEGLNSSGILVGEEITLNGTTPVSSVISYSRILGRSINGFMSGNLTITSNAGAVTNLVVGPRQRQTTMPTIIFYPQPDASATLYYDATMTLPDIVNDNDMSLIPEVYHDAIESYCLYKGYLHKKDKESAAMAMQDFMKRVDEARVDDIGPRKSIVMRDFNGSNRTFEPRFPSNFPVGS